MTIQEQFLACAELDGLEWCPDKDGCWHWLNKVTGWFCGKRLFPDESTINIADLPNYNTRDAVIGVIEKQPKRIQLSVIKLLDTDCIDGWYDWQVLKVLLAPPSQLREALLRATGKWK